METTHRVVTGDSRELDALGDGSVELVVTSPPYPMIEMWDDAFASLDPAIGDRLAADDGDAAYARMHDALAETWAEVERVLIDGGIACVNVGDATRSIGGRFQSYPNHVAVTDWFTSNGFHALPDVLWRKPTNSAAKFMGSGMLPPSAYVTLEHEYVLVFRKGDRRSFEPGATRRYESAFFWEERNRWFSDVWEGITGERQGLGDDTGSDDAAVRERSGAFPFEIPYRLVNMYSVHGDTVLDPFLGTGTTTLAAAIAGRNSVGYEIDTDVVAVVDDRLAGIEARSREVVQGRLDRHRTFVEQKRAAGEEPGYDAEHYPFPVVTKQERRLRLYAVASLQERTTAGRGPDASRGGAIRTYEATHVPVEAAEGGVATAGDEAATDGDGGAATDGTAGDETAE